MWLNPCIFEWKSFVEGSSILGANSWERSYKIWSHAENILASPTTEMSRVDAVTTLKRAIEHRVRLLNRIYSFRNIPIKEKPARTFDQFEFLGIVRPVMLQKLIAIRNAVEHEDASPPNAETCEVFLEFAWYFLRSTDGIARTIVGEFSLQPMWDEELWGYYWLSVNMNLESCWIPGIRGWVTPYMISEEERTDWIALRLERTETRAALLEGLEDENDMDVSRMGRNIDDMYIVGEIHGSTDAMRKLHKIYWNLV